METINVTKDEKERLEYFAKTNKTTVNKLILRLIEELEDEYDLKVYKEYLKEKENGTLKTYSHKEVWGE